MLITGKKFIFYRHIFQRCNLRYENNRNFLFFRPFFLLHLSSLPSISDGEWEVNMNIQEDGSTHSKEINNKWGLKINRHLDSIRILLVGRVKGDVGGAGRKYEKVSRLELNFFEAEQAVWSSVEVKLTLHWCLRLEF